MNFINDRPGRIRKIKIKPSAPQCWTANQLVEIVQAVRSLRRELKSDSRVRRAIFWTAFVLVGYYSALRQRQGEDVVAGIRTPEPISKMKEQLPKAYEQLVQIRADLEKHFKEMQDGDLLSLRWDQIQDGLIVRPMSKTGDIIVCSLPSDALEQLEKLRGGGRVLVFGQLMNDKNCRYFFWRSD